MRQKRLLNGLRRSWKRRSSPSTPDGEKIAGCACAVSRIAAWNFPPGSARSQCSSGVAKPFLSVRCKTFSGMRPLIAAFRMRLVMPSCVLNSSGSESVNSISRWSRNGTRASMLWAMELRSSQCSSIGSVVTVSIMRESHCVVTGAASPGWRLHGGPSARPFFSSASHASQACCRRGGARRLFAAASQAGPNQKSRLFAVSPSVQPCSSRKRRVSCRAPANRPRDSIPSRCGPKNCG